MLSASYGTEDREIFSVVGGQAAAAGGNDTRTEAGRALRRGEAGDAAWYDIHLPPQPQCCLHKPLDDGTVADSLGTKITCEGALLHDYFLYDWHEKNAGHRFHGFIHAGRALQNAKNDFELTRREENIISRHMFPLNIVPPMCKEAWLVCLADKICASKETIVRRIHIRRYKK